MCQSNLIARLVRNFLRCSSREPSQVFSLLESTYAVFDGLAKVGEIGRVILTRLLSDILLALSLLRDVVSLRWKRLLTAMVRRILEQI